MNRFIKRLNVISFAALMVFAFPNYADNNSASMSHRYSSKSNDNANKAWLPDLSVVPDKEQVEQFNKQIATFISEEKDRRCRKIDPQIRKMVFRHFLMNQYMANGQNIYFDEKIAHKWAQVLAMILKESSGDTTNITDMKGHSVTTYSAHTNLKNWNSLFNNAVQGRVKFNYQTNFGLTQLSADRLYVALNLAKNPGLDTQFLEGTKNVDLNTAIAIRRLIWFYQYFSQGRVSQSTDRLSQKEITSPEYSERYQTGLQLALLHCGTHFLFHKKHSTNEKKELSELENTMAAIAYCKLGTSKGGYGKDEFDEKCFAEWVTFCPALNVDIALLTPLRYFETRKAKLVCENTFKRMLNKKTGN